MTRILIADDSQPVRCGLRTLLGLKCRLGGLWRSRGWCRCRRKGTPTSPDLIWMDFSMPQIVGVQAGREIAKSGTDIPILLHSESFTSTHGIGSQRWVAGRDFRVGNQQVTM